MHPEVVQPLQVKVSDVPPLPLGVGLSPVSLFALHFDRGFRFFLQVGLLVLRSVELLGGCVGLPGRSSQLLKRKEPLWFLGASAWQLSLEWRDWGTQAL